MSQTLHLGGWLCRALLIWEPELRGTRTALTNPGRSAGIETLCGNGTTTKEDDELVVVGVHHNGLGNTLYQYSVARLLAWSVGASYASTLISEREGALDTRLPPHSIQAWSAFWDIFNPADLRLNRRTNLAHGSSDATCSPVSPARGEYVANGTIVYGDRPADRRRRKPKETLRDLVAGLTKRRFAFNRSEANLTCVKLLGYFQDYSLLAGLMPLVRQWLPLRPRRLAETPLPTDIVVHVRLCRTNFHAYTYYSVENYYGPILDRLTGDVKLVTACPIDKRGVAMDLVRKYGATLVRPAGASRDTAADFVYMTRATTLVISESTFSWWAAALSNATQVHAPGLKAAIAPAWDDPRYVFHDVHTKRYWGTYADHAITYALHLDRGGADDPATTDHRSSGKDHSA